MENMADKNPLVSIIVPVYQAERYIGDSIKSAINQTYENIEIILVDDGSKDCSIEIAENLLSKSKRVYHTIHQVNAGSGAARNIGLTKANGDWVFFLDSDDIILDDTIECMIQVIKEYGVEFVFSKFVEVKTPQYKRAKKKDEIRSVTTYLPNGLQYCFLKREVIVLVPGTLFKKDFLIKNSIIFSESHWEEDIEFIWHVLCKMHQAVRIDATKYHYVRHCDSKTSSTSAGRMVDSYHDFISKIKTYYKDDGCFTKHIIARWAMGTLNAAARIMEFEQWNELYKKLDGFENFNNLKDFPHTKTRMAALIGRLSPLLYYKTVRFSSFMK